MRCSISVRLFGERERDQNKRDNKRPSPAERAFLEHGAQRRHKGPEVRPLPQGLRSGPAALHRFEGPSLSFKQPLLRKGQGRVVGFARGGVPGPLF